MATIKTISDEKLKKKYEITVPFGDIEKLVDKKAEEKQKTVKIDGFRPGKVPLDVVKNKFSATIIAECAEDMVDKEIKNIIDKNNFNLLSRPEVDVVDYPTKGVDLKFNVTLELFPEVPDIKFEKISLKKKVVKLTDEDLKEGLEKLVKSKANWKTQDASHAAKNSDKVKINFLGKIDGVPFDGGKADGYELELGSKSFIDTFEDQLVGKKAGDKVDVNVKFPDNYGKKELEGKPAVFEVEVLEVKSAEPIELNDENAKEHFNVENVEALKNMIRDELTKMYEKSSNGKIKSDIFEWIAKNVKVELPQKLVDEEYKRQWKSVEQELERNPNLFKDEKEKKKEEEKLKEVAEDSIKIGLIFSELGKKNDIKVDNTEIIEEIRKMASAYPGSEQMFIDFYSKNRGALNEITGRLLEEKVVNFITSKADVKEEAVTSKEFVESLNKKN